MKRISLQTDSPSYLKISRIQDELLEFASVLDSKYDSIDFEFAFCFRVLYSTDGINSTCRFHKKENWLGLDLIMPESEFISIKNNINDQRKILGKYFYPFFSEAIHKYSKKIPALKSCANSLLADMKFFLQTKEWLSKQTE